MSSAKRRNGVAEPGRRMFPVPSSQPIETWQVGLARLPLWLPPAGEGKPARAWIAVCLGVDSGSILPSAPGREEEIPSLVEALLSRAGWRWRVHPARVQVADVALAGILEDLLAPHGIPVETVAELPGLRGFVSELLEFMTPPDTRPSPLTGDGVTVERLRAFARAAANFYASSCWKFLSGDDLVRVEAPEVAEELRHFKMDRPGVRSMQGLVFAKAGDYKALLERDLDEVIESWQGFWEVELDCPWDAPPDDLELWERYGLPWVGEDLCPVACFLGVRGSERPDRRQLAFFEGLLSALAATTEEEIDSGRWEKQVATAEGSVRYVLSLPGLLEEEGEAERPRPTFLWSIAERSLREVGKLLGGRKFGSVEEANEAIASLMAEESRSEPETPEDKALELLVRAQAARGRRQVLLAREALEVWPDCADAYNLLAGAAADAEESRRLFALGVAAGERALGPGMLDDAGHFWGLIETRPYMRARQGLAEALVELKRFEEAAEHFGELLRLNPDDNQGVRYTLVNLLITLGRDAEAEDLADRYEGEDSALLAFPRALLAFRREGDSFEARRRLKQAMAANRFIPGLLLRTREPSAPPSAYYTSGSEAEAVLYLLFSGDTWPSTPGAFDWLRERKPKPARPKAKAKRKKKRRRLR